MATRIGRTSDQQVDQQINHAGPVPKRRQLRDLLVELARTELGPDDAIPSERELMAHHRVSRMTVREAIGELVNQGVLYRVHGKGTFVAHRRVESQLHLASFTNDMLARGYRPGTVVLRAEEAPPPEEVAAGLRIARGRPAYRIERLRTADGVPMAVEHGWYSPALAPGLLDCDLAGSLYSTLAERFGVVIDRGEQTVWAATAGPPLARQLGVRAGAPLLVFHRRSSAGRRPVEDVTSYYRGDRYQVQMSLERTHPGGSA